MLGGTARNWGEGEVSRVSQPPPTFVSYKVTGVRGQRPKVIENSTPIPVPFSTKPLSGSLHCIQLPILSTAYLIDLQKNTRWSFQHNHTMTCNTECTSPNDPSPNFSMISKHCSKKQHGLGFRLYVFNTLGFYISVCTCVRV